MGIVLPTEADIRTAVLKLRPQPARFQALAEQYLAIREGGSYARLTPKGRNADGVAIKGYPDAYAYRADGGMIVVEATVGDWRQHIRDEDIPGITDLGVGNVHSFHFFSMSASESPIPQKNASAVRRAETEREVLKRLRDDLGVKSAEIVFLDRLCAELRHPKYLTLLLDLGLSISFAPFQAASEVIPSGPEAIIPTLEEFDDELVVPRMAYDRILDTLSTAREAFVEGRGASGKTCMALALGRAWGAAGRVGSAYYFDFESFDDADARQTAALEAAIVTLASRQTLLIFDNCHTLRRGYLLQVLAVTRQGEDRSAAAWFSRPNAARLDEIFPTAARFIREASTEDLFLIYKRLVARVRVGAPDPPPEALASWKSMRGDLVAFSLALTPRLKAFRQGGDWVLSDDRAVDYVRAKYLDALPPRDRREVIRISALAALEIPTSRQSLGGAEPEEALASGLVLRSAHGGTGSRIRFRLAHHALGALLLAASDAVGEDEIDDDFIRRDVFQSAYVARRLYEQGDRERAKRILRLIRPLIVGFSPDIPPGYLGPITQLLVDAGVATDAELEADLLGHIDRFPSGEVPVVGLSGFFGFTYGRMPALHAAAMTRVRRPEVLKAITDTYDNAPASAIMSMVHVSATHELGVTEALLKPLSDPETQGVVAVSLLDQTFPEIDGFLVNYGLHDAAGRDRLVASLKGHARLRQRSQDFLRQPFAVIQQTIFESPSATTFILGEVSAEAWRTRDWSLDVNLPDFVLWGMGNLDRIGRLDLAEEVARQTALRRDSAVWAQGRRAARLLVAISRHGRALGPVLLQSLGQDLREKEWLDALYSHLQPKRMITLMIRLWASLTPVGLGAFRTDKLEKLLGKRLRSTALRDTASVGLAVQAAGLMQTFGMTVPAVDPTLFPFDPPAGVGADVQIYWIGYAALAGPAPAGLPPRPWSKADLATLPSWVAKALRKVDRWAGR